MPSVIAYIAVFSGIYEHRDLVAALIRGAVKVVNFARLKETIRRVLRRNIALGSGEKLVTDHEFLNRSRAQ